ncbi:hypothetical protein NEILACOT_04798 [Neisseria lactamica ATCC 23970]|uniref:Uncharacterized protein n=1 Tax=Neisseria lactamica ATCC 23970 TaxID=546265 RepID=D0WB73_NEILA|nr:hypothetical protein NEILACOT_04798 [Neisseria lactamica ATCC 23970]
MQCNSKGRRTVLPMFDIREVYRFRVKLPTFPLPNWFVTLLNKMPPLGTSSAS